MPTATRLVRRRLIDEIAATDAKTEADDDKEQAS